MDWNNKKDVLAAVQKDGDDLQYASAELQNDKEVVLAAVKQYGYLLRFASPELRNDKDVVLAAVERDGFALCFAGAELLAELEQSTEKDKFICDAIEAVSYVKSNPMLSSVYYPEK